MHASNKSQLPAVTPQPRPLVGVIAALNNSDGIEAVRQLQRAIALHALESQNIVEAFIACGAKGLLPHLISALAHAPCPHCRGGFENCSSCHGAGHAEERSSACSACAGLGIAPCDFCGGSGLMTYDAVPEPLCASVAMRRVQSAAGRIAEEANNPTPTAVSRDGISALRKAIMKRAVSIRHDLAILANAAQLARALRETYPEMHAFTGQLFQRASRSAKIGQHVASRLFTILGRLSLACASNPGTALSAEFETQRAEQFETHARRFAEAARHRSTLFPGR
jgi:hypothetical protein